MEYTGNSCSRRGCFVYYEFYIDQFIAEQLLTGYLLLSVSVRLQKKEVSRKKIAAGSIADAVLEAVFICLGIPGGGLAGMLTAGLIVFWRREKHGLTISGRSRVYCLAVDMISLLFVTVCFGGTLELLLSLLPLPAVFGSLAASLLIKKGWQHFCRNGLEHETFLSVRLYWQDRKETFQAIRDTGNQLTEPLTKVPVSIVDADAADRLLGKEWEQRRGFYMIPYHSLGTEKSWMRGVKIDRLEILSGDQKAVIEHPVLALYDGKVSSGNRYQVILHPQHCQMK